MKFAALAATALTITAGAAAAAPLAQEAQQVTRNVPAELIYAPTDQAAQINDEVPVTRGTVRHTDADQFYSFGDRAKMGLDAERTVGVTTFPRGETGPLPDNGR
ncbi:hypothetical protein ACX9MO_09185 [Pseudooceanicola sp. 502str34]